MKGLEHDKWALQALHPTKGELPWEWVNMTVNSLPKAHPTNSALAEPKEGSQQMFWIDLSALCWAPLAAEAVQGWKGTEITLRILGWNFGTRWDCNSWTLNCFLNILSGLQWYLCREVPTRASLTLTERSHVNGRCRLAMNRKDTEQNSTGLQEAIRKKALQRLRENLVCCHINQHRSGSYCPEASRCRARLCLSWSLHVSSAA